MLDKIKYISMPSLLVFLVIVLSSYITTEPVYDNDLWWHMKTGEYILENKEIPNKDIFSFYGMENDLDWMAHEWLSDIILYKVYDWFGFKGLIMFPILFLSLTIMVLFQTYREQYYKFFLPGIVWLFATGFTLSIFSSTRPHMFSFLLFALTIFIIQRFIKGNHKIIWTLPFISMLWVNLHGGSSALLFVILIFTLISGIFKINIGKLKTESLERTKVKRIIQAMFLSLLTACINPYGYKMILYPFVNMADNRMLSFIAEWQSPNLHTPEGIAIFIVISIPIVYMLISKKEITLYELMIVGAFAFLSFKSIRQVSYFVIAVTPIMLVHLPVIERKIDNPPKYINFAIGTMISFLFIGNLLITMNSPVNKDIYPSNDVITAISDYKPERMLNDYNWGGYLIWELYDEDIHVFVDGRADIFSKYILDDYERMYLLSQGWQNDFDKHNFDSALLISNSLLASYLVNELNWKVKYKDDNIIFITKSRIPISSE